MKRTRQDKYPNTSTFTYYNANPKNKITADCIMRAISLATGIEYNKVVMDLAELQCKTGEADPYPKYLASLGWIKHAQPRKYDNTKFTGKEFCKFIQKHDVDNPNYPLNRVIAHIGGHHIVAIIGGKVHDIWDSTDGCIGNYWTKA